MAQEQQSSADNAAEPKKRRRIGFSVADAGVEAKECIKIYLVYSKEDVGSSGGTCINPVDLSNFFEEDGNIYGYHGLKVTIWINGISFHAYADITYQSSSDGGKGITDLKSALQKIYAETLLDSKDEFLQTFSREIQYIRSITSEGKLLQQQEAINGNAGHCDGIFEVPNSDLEVRRMGIGDSNAGHLYSRLVPLVLLLVDGSSPIDVTDSGWELYLLIQKQTEQQERHCRLVGFAAVYRFYHYPDASRMRLSQILILPPYQRKGYGSYLVKVLNSVAVSENVYDFTVEEPSESFQHVRTCVDIHRLLAFEPIQKELNSAVQYLKQGKLSKKPSVAGVMPPSGAVKKVTESLKINRKQFLKCWEILIYLGLHPMDKLAEDNYTAFISDIVHADVLEKDPETAGKCVVEVSSPHDPEMSFVMFRSQHKGKSSTQMDETQEEQLNQLICDRIREIKLVAQKFVPTA